MGVEPDVVQSGHHRRCPFPRHIGQMERGEELPGCSHFRHRRTDTARTDDQNLHDTNLHDQSPQPSTRHDRCRATREPASPPDVKAVAAKTPLCTISPMTNPNDPPMGVSVDDVDAAIETALTTITGPVDIGPASTGRTRPDAFDVAVTVEGRHGLHVTFRIDRTDGHQLTELAWRTTGLDDVDVTDCLGELANIVAGNLKAVAADPHSPVTPPRPAIDLPEPPRHWQHITRHFTAATCTGQFTVTWGANHTPVAP